MAVLQIKWESLSRLPTLAPAEKPVVTTEVGAGSEAKPADDDPAPAASDLPKVLDKPYMIYISDSTQTTSFDGVEKVVLADDRVVIGSHAFHAVKMSPEDAKADPLLAERGGKELPRIVFVSSDLKSVNALENTRLSVAGTWEAMKATANKHYKENLDTVVKGLRDVLTEFDRVNQERKVLEDKEARKGGPEITAADKKAIETKRAELDTRQKKAEEKQAKLETLNPKLAA
jgi:hypothetical protein